MFSFSLLINTVLSNKMLSLRMCLLSPSKWSALWGQALGLSPLCISQEAQSQCSLNGVAIWSDAGSSSVHRCISMQQTCFWKLKSILNLCNWILQTFSSEAVSFKEACLSSPGVHWASTPLYGQVLGHMCVLRQGMWYALACHMPRAIYSVHGIAALAKFCYIKGY